MATGPAGHSPRRPLPADLDFGLLKAHRPTRYPLLLESPGGDGPQATRDLLFIHDGTGLALAADSITRSLAGEAVTGSFLEALDRAYAACAPRPAPPSGGISGCGYALYLGYELAAQLEPTARLVAADRAEPVALALRCPCTIVRSRPSGEVWLHVEPGAEALADAVCQDIEILRSGAPRRAGLPDLSVGPHPRQSVNEEPPQRFVDGVRRVLDWLKAGDVFQVNLSRRSQWLSPVEVDVGRLYRCLRQANPAPFAGLLEWRGFAVASSSPERLVRIEGRRVETRPIAGTRPRVAADDEPAKIAELIGNLKERAEHVMLIDLERNDLGRVCEAGTIAVDELMAVESYAHVHHIVSNVAGRLRDRVTAGQVIAAVFPGGTITGCPKVRCMQIIAELEAAPRGAYTGAIGYLAADGTLDLNILIRSLVVRGQQISFRTGAGIVIDSMPDAELAETRAKAQGLIAALALYEASG